MPEPDDLRGLHNAYLHDSPTSHDYLSTACAHDVCGSCRNTCKFCGSSCSHGCHPQAGEQPASPVDQARDIATELLGVIRAAGVDLDAVAPGLAARLRDDPGLFWARGECMPSGEWKAPGEQPASETIRAWIAARRWGEPLLVVVEGDKGFDADDAKWTVTPELLDGLRKAQAGLLAAENVITAHLKMTGQPPPRRTPGHDLNDEDE